MTRPRTCPEYFVCRGLTLTSLGPDANSMLSRAFRRCRLIRRACFLRGAQQTASVQSSRRAPAGVFACAPLSRNNLSSSWVCSVQLVNRIPASARRMFRLSCAVNERRLLILRSADRVLSRRPPRALARHVSIVTSLHAPSSASRGASPLPRLPQRAAQAAPARMQPIGGHRIIAASPATESLGPPQFPTPG